MHYQYSLCVETPETDRHRSNRRALLHLRYHRPSQLLLTERCWSHLQEWVCSQY
uniref:Uncharacterized protein n=1 Tax=Ascaris lumbricoides TaxID=6252 RepID=A0A0M3HHK7_ASCLU